MPYRDQPLEEVCNRCHEPATARCRRCGAPLCGAHAPAPWRRCERCEARYAAGGDRAVVVLGVLEILAILVLGGAVLGSSVYSEAMPPLVTLTAVVAALGLPPLLLPQIRRTLFLVSRRPWRAIDDRP